MVPVESPRQLIRKIDAMISASINDALEVRMFLSSLAMTIPTLNPTWRFISGDGQPDEMYDWLFEDYESFSKYLVGRSFENIPLIHKFAVECRVSDVAFGRKWFNHIFGAIKDDGLTGVYASVSMIIKEPDKPTVIASVRCEAGRDNAGCFPHLAFSVFKGRHAGIEKFVNGLGVDERLSSLLADAAPNSLNFLSLSERGFALVGPDRFGKFEELVEEFSLCGTDKSFGCVISFVVIAPGYELVQGRDVQKYREIDRLQKMRADAVIEMVSALGVRDGWKFWINAVSEREIFSANWDRAGSVLEHIPFERVIGRIVAGDNAVIQEIIASWDGASYALSFPGLEAASDVSSLIRTLGIELK